MQTTTSVLSVRMALFLCVTTTEVHWNSLHRAVSEQLSESERRASELERAGAELAEPGAAGRLALGRLTEQLTEPTDGEEGTDAEERQDVHLRLVSGWRCGRGPTCAAGRRDCRHALSAARMRNFCNVRISCPVLDTYKCH